jgi:Tol biopolymer transport system component
MDMKKHASFPRVLTVIAVVGLLGALASAQGQADADQLLQRARTKAVVEGKLDEAVKLYADIAAKFKSDRPTAVRALIEMADCYEKMGQAKARELYEQVVRDYGDQSDAVSQARARLAALGGARLGTTVSVAKVSDAEVLAVSGDGRLVADGASGEPVLSIRDLVHGDVRVLRKETKGWVEAGGAFSPDGRQLAYPWYKDDAGWLELHVSATDGSGGPRMVFRCNETITWLIPFGWSPDGRSILSLLLAAKEKWTSIALIDVADGTVRELKRFDGAWSVGHPAMSPDGSYVVYARSRGANAQQADVMILSTADLRERPLVENPANDAEPVWTPDGKGVVFRSNRRGTTDLWLQPVADGQPNGEPQVVRAEVGEVRLLGISRAGTLAYISRTSHRYAFTVPFDPETGRAGKPVRLGDRVIAPGSPVVWSPDGRTLALLRPAPPRLVLHTQSDGSERELTLDVSQPVLSGWFPDGRSVLVSGVDGQGQNAFIRYYADPPRAERLPLMGSWWKEVSIARDGKTAFAAVGQSIRAFDVASGQARVITGTGANVPSLAAAPDGRQIAYIEAADDEKATALWLVNVDGGVPQRIATLPFATRGRGLAWTPDGRYVLMADDDSTGKKSGIRRVSVADGTFVSSGVALDGMGNGLSISPDGRQLAVASGVAKTESWVLENFLPKAPAAPGGRSR